MIDATDILHAPILIVDDHEENVRLLERLLHDAGYTRIDTTTDPTAVCALHARNRYGLILLDLRMPGMDGFDVMEALSRTESEGYLPVLVVTAEPDQKLRALHAGAKDFIGKPFDLAEVLARVHNMLEVRLLQRELRQHGETLEARVRTRTAELEASYLEMILTMTRAAEYKDQDTGAHVHRISYYCREFAGKLGMDAEFTQRIGVASPMHDIGKIGIPDLVLLKRGSLNPEEWTIMKQHSAMGAEILGASVSPYVHMGAEIAQNHHERWDGSGYPNGLRGEVIPLTARIMNICDIYDALRSRRPYKPAIRHEQAVDIIVKGDGRTSPGHFDPALVASFQGNHALFRDIFEAHIVPFAGA